MWDENHALAKPKIAYFSCKAIKKFIKRKIQQVRDQFSTVKYLFRSGLLSLYLLLYYCKHTYYFLKACIGILLSLLTYRFELRDKVSR